MVKKDQVLVNNFLKEFVQKIVEGFGKYIDFILLFGSAARGEWKRGVSDVDLIIQVKNPKIKNEVYKKAEQIFWELDEKYDTKFKDVCSIKKPEKISLVEAIRFAEKQIRLYVPFEVVEPGEIDWKRCEFNNPLYKVGAFLIFPKSMFFLKIKSEGKVLFGRDILKELKPCLSFWDVSKILLNPYHLSVLSVLTVLFTPNFAIKHAIKAILYEIESVLIFLERPIATSSTKAYERVKRTINNKYLDWDVVEEAFDLKYDWDEKIEELGYWDKITFCWKVLTFVIVLSWLSVFTKIYISTVKNYLK
jgi:predicted nucleotidyltransferase